MLAGFCLEPIMSQSHEYQQFNLTNALLIPQVRDRFQRGVKLHELAQMKEFFIACSNDSYIRKTYGKMVQDLEFLESSGAMKLPAAIPGNHISSRKHWVAISGYYKVDYTSLCEEGIDIRTVVNTLSILAPILILDNDAWSIYNAVVRYTRAPHSVALQYLIYVLSTLQQTGMPYGGYVDDRFVKWLMWSKDPEEVFSHNQQVSSEVLQDDKVGIMPKLLDGSYCMPMNNHWSFSDGWYYNVTVPSWTLSDRDYIDNQLSSWDFFTVEV